MIELIGTITVYVTVNDEGEVHQVTADDSSLEWVTDEDRLVQHNQAMAVGPEIMLTREAWVSLIRRAKDDADSGQEWPSWDWGF